MKSFFKSFTAIILLVFFVSQIYSQDYHVRIGFIGNSITIGTGLPNPTVDCYPSQIGVLLKEKFGDTCIIENYAVSGRTLLKKGDYPIWNEASFKACWNSAPDICFISLGTNDTKPYNWDKFGNEFFTDYMAMIDTFKKRNPRTKFIVCRPDPAFGVVFDIRNIIIVNNVIPLVDSIAKETGAELVDFYTPMLDSASLFPDKIHPNPRGAKAMAKIAYEKIIASDIIHKVEKGYTFVTALKSSVSTELRMKDSASISWTTMNADEAFLNGKKVALNGSIKVAPLENTNYVLKAKGVKGEDSLVLLQKVYKPALTKVSVTLSKPLSSIYQTDTIEIVLKCFDQKSRVMNDTTFTVDWQVKQGYGRFINEGSNRIKFIADSAGVTIVGGSITDVNFSTSLPVNNKKTSIEYKENGAMLVYPNPAENALIFDLQENTASKVKIKITDLSGRLYMNELFNVSNKKLELNISGLKQGNYFYEMELNGKLVSGKFIKK